MKYRVESNGECFRIARGIYFSPLWWRKDSYGNKGWGGDSSLECHWKDVLFKSYKDALKEIEIQFGKTAKVEPREWRKA